MELLKLFIVFALMMIILIVFKRPLWMSTLAGIIVSVIIYQISIANALRITGTALISQSTIEILAVVYLVNFLQVMMQQKGAIARAEKAMLRLFTSRRAIVIFAPIFMGLLPAPNAVVLSAPIVDSTAGSDLGVGDKMFLTSYLRHVPESAFPLYPGLLLAIGVTRLSPGLFLLGVLPLAAISIGFCYITKLRKIPAGFDNSPDRNPKKDLLEMITALWPIILLIVVVLFGGLSTALSTLAVCILLYVVYRYPISNLPGMMHRAFSVPIIVGLAMIMIFKDIIASTGIVQALPDIFESLPIPLYLVYALITFIGGLTGMINAVIGVLFPIAFASIPGAGIPLLLLLMGFSHSASQLSPTHICLEIAVNYFKSDFRTLIINTLPVTLFYCFSAVIYYILLTAVF